jgi:hypothetical protein
MWRVSKSEIVGKVKVFDSQRKTTFFHKGAAQEGRQQDGAACIQEYYSSYILTG